MPTNTTSTESSERPDRLSQMPPGEKRPSAMQATVLRPTALQSTSERPSLPRASGMQPLLNWLSSLRLGAMISTRVKLLARGIGPLTSGWRWLPAAVIVGAIPLLLGLLFESSGHQLLTALLLAGLSLSLVWRDAWWTGLATIGVVFVTHSALAIGITYFQPSAVGALFPGGADYWDKQYDWITTGVDVEYELWNWIPAHAFLLLGTTLFSITSFGIVTFHHGFFEVDLMNYYNGQLLRHSDDGYAALFWGWHIWSILRGLAYTVLSYELIAISIRIFGRRSLVTWSQHAKRLGIGLGLLLADGITKYYMMEIVRIQLLHNLSVD